MKIFGGIGACMLVALLATTTVAQDAEEAPEAPPSQYDRVKQLQPYLGFWQGDFTAPNGDQGMLTGMARWTSNRSYAQFQWSFRPEDAGPREQMHVVTVLMGWDGKHERLTAWSFFPEGQGAGAIEMTDNGFVINAEGTSVEGDATSSKATYELDGDKLTVTVSDVTVGDQSVPGYSFTVAKRQMRGRGNRAGGRRNQAAEAE